MSRLRYYSPRTMYHGYLIELIDEVYTERGLLIQHQFGRLTYGNLLITQTPIMTPSEIYQELYGIVDYLAALLEIPDHIYKNTRMEYNLDSNRSSITFAQDSTFPH